MTVSSAERRIEFTGNGSQTVYPYNFRIFSASDLVIYVNGALKVLTSDYTVSSVDNPSGGNVTFVTAPASGHSIVFFSDTVEDQTTDYIPQGPLPAETLERTLDKLTVIVQEHEEILRRTLTFKQFSLLKDKTLDDLVAGRVAGVRADSSGIEWLDKNTLNASLSESNILSGFTKVNLPTTVRQLNAATDDVRGPFIGTGTLARALNGDFANLLDFVTAGAGTEASPYTGSFQSAFSTGKVFIPPYWFSIGSTSMVVNLDGALIVGMGYNSVIVFSGIADAPSGEQIGAISVYKTGGGTIRGVRLSNFRINGSTAKTGTTPSVTLQKPAGILIGQGGGANGSDPADITVDHLFFEKMPYQAMAITSVGPFDGTSRFIRILNNRFSNSNGGGITGNSGDLVDALISGNAFTLENLASIEWASGGAIIAHNHIFDVDGSGIAALNNTSDTRWTVISNNTLNSVADQNGSGSPGAGIQWGQSAAANRVLIANNALRNIAGHGIVVTGPSGSSGDAHITGNVVEGFGTAGRTPSPDISVKFIGILARNMLRTHVVGNVVRALGSRDEGEGYDIGGSLATTNMFHGNVALGTFDVKPYSIGTNSDAGWNSEGTSNITPATLTADVNDYNPSWIARVWRLATDATPRNITGIAGGFGGRTITIINNEAAGGTNIVLVRESASSAAANRIETPGAANITLAVRDAADLIYDDVTSRWRAYKR